MRAATEGSLPPVMPQGNLVEVLGREVRQGSPGELMVESPPSRQRRPPCETNKEESDEAADEAALTYLLTPWCPVFPCCLPSSPLCPSPTPGAACSPCLLLPLPPRPVDLPCTAPACRFRCLPLSRPPSHWPWCPVAARLLCPACPSPPCGLPLGWLLCLPPVPSCSPWRSDLPLPDPISSRYMVSGSGFGAWQRRRRCSMCARASYRAVCWRRASLSFSARTAALTCGGDPGGCRLNNCWGCGHLRPCPPPLPPIPSWCPAACLAPDAPTCFFPPLPVWSCPPVRTPLSPPSAAPAPVCPLLPLPSSLLCTSRRIDFMAAAGILVAVGCFWPPASAILLASSSSSSDTTRMSATTDPPNLSLSARLKGSARGRAAAYSPAPPPSLQLPLLQPPPPRHLPPLVLPCPLPPLSLPPPLPSAPALLLAVPTAALSPDSPETGTTTPQRRTPSASVR